MVDLWPPHIHPHMCICTNTHDKPRQGLGAYAEDMAKEQVLASRQKGTLNYWNGSPALKPWHSWLLLWAPGAQATLSPLWISMQALAFCRDGELGYHDRSEMQIHLRKKNQHFFSEVQLMKVSGKFISTGCCTHTTPSFYIHVIFKCVQNGVEFDLGNPFQSMAFFTKQKIYTARVLHYPSMKPSSPSRGRSARK